MSSTDKTAQQMMQDPAVLACTHAVGFQCECSCGGENHATQGGMFTGLLAA